MLYALLKIWVRLGSVIFCRKFIINNPSLLKMKGPLLLASNHPNSFLDAVILDILFKEPVWSLTRGDAFKKPFYKKLLYRLRMIPVYRTSEGADNLEANYNSFDRCKQIFRENGLVLVFSEGLCLNEWHLRPLKKGTARLAYGSWKEGIPLMVLPVGINYSSFNKVGKNIFLNFGNKIEAGDFPEGESEGNKHKLFNERLQSELSKLVYEIPSDQMPTNHSLVIPVPRLKKILLAIPAAFGYFLNAPFYLPLRFYANNAAAHAEFVDGILTALLVLFYPLYLAMITIIIFWITCSWLSLGALFLLPFTAWAYIQVKKQV